MSEKLPPAPALTPTTSLPSAATLGVPDRVATLVVSYTLSAALTPLTVSVAGLMLAVTAAGCTSV